jgi:hypothetical protein
MHLTASTGNRGEQRESRENRQSQHATWSNEMMHEPTSGVDIPDASDDRINIAHPLRPAAIGSDDRTEITRTLTTWRPLAKGPEIEANSVEESFGRRGTRPGACVALALPL